MVRGLRIGVVGGGIIGCATAFELARRGCSVTVFEKRLVGGGATQASAGILAPLIEGHDHGALLDMGVRSLSRYDEFVARLRQVSSVEFEYGRPGTLEIADTPERATALRRTQSLRADAEFEWLDDVRLRQLEPAVNPRFPGGLWCRTHGFVAVMPFVSAMVDAARKYEATFHESTEVLEIACDRGSCIVRSDRGTEHFDRLVLSAGSWAPLLDPLGEIGSAVRPIKGQLVVLKNGAVRVRRVVWGGSCYIVPWRDGTLLVGATAEDVGFDERPTAGAVQELLSAAADLLSGLEHATFLGVRVGLRPGSAEGLPILGPSLRDPRVFYATGHFRNGVLLAPLTAEAVAGYFLDEQLDPALRVRNGA